MPQSSLPASAEGLPVTREQVEAQIDPLINRLDTTDDDMPMPGDLIVLSGGCVLAVALTLDQHKNFVKVVTVRKDGKREIGHYLIEALGGPDHQRLASLIRFYDTCAGFFDGSAIVAAESEIETLIRGVRTEVFELIRTTATAVREFDSPTNYSRARVLLDFAERSGAGSVEIEQCRAALNAAKEASRAQLDLTRYYQKMREAGYDPTVTGFGGRVAINFSLIGIRDDRPSEADEVEDADIDFDLRRDYVLALWKRRGPGALVVPLGV